METPTKERVVKAIQAMPNDATTEDIIERILLLQAIDEGIAQGQRGDVVEDEDLPKHLPKWFA